MAIRQAAQGSGIDPSGSAMGRTSRYLVVAAFVLAAGLGCEKCSGPGNTPARVEIRVGYQPFTSDLAIFVALERGYFSEQGLTPVTSKFVSTTDFLNALVANRIDVAGIIGSPTFFARECESPGLVKIFLPAVETEQRYVACFLVRKDSDVRSLQQLKGKTVGTYTGTTQALNLRYILGKFFDVEKDVRIVQVSSELQLTALKAGQFDALLTIEPYSTIGVSQGVARVLEANPRCKYIMSPFPASAQVVSTEFLKRNPETFKKYYAAIRKAVNFINANPTEAKAILPKYTELTGDEARQSNMYEWQYDETANKAKFQDLADLYSQAGVLPRKIDVSIMFPSLTTLGLGAK